MMTLHFHSSSNIQNEGKNNLDEAEILSAVT